MVHLLVFLKIRSMHLFDLPGPETPDFMISRQKLFISCKQTQCLKIPLFTLSSSLTVGMSVFELLMNLFLTIIFHCFYESIY